MKKYLLYILPIFTILIGGFLASAVSYLLVVDLLYGIPPQADDIIGILLFYVFSIVLMVIGGYIFRMQWNSRNLSKISIFFTIGIVLCSLILIFFYLMAGSDYFCPTGANYRAIDKLPSLHFWSQDFFSYTYTFLQTKVCFSEPGLF